MDSQMVQKINKLMAQTKRVITSKKQTKLPFIRNTKSFNFKTWKYQKSQAKYQITLGQETLKLITKLLEILLIVKQNLKSNQSITKRNLFYQLVQYYDQYSSIDNDIEILCASLSEVQMNGSKSLVKRKDLNILASTRSMVIGNIQLRVNQFEKVIGTSSSILTLPLSKQIEVVNIKFTKILIIQKQSILFDFIQPKNGSERQQFFDDFLIITSKGYPDNRIKDLLNILEPKVKQIYYLGDCDVYGFDILLSYAFGDWQYNGIFKKVKWLSLERLISKGYCQESILQKTYIKISLQDTQKASKVKQKEYLKIQRIQKAYQNDQQGKFFIQKISRWKASLDSIVDSGKKIQIEGVQSSIKDQNWIMSMIKQEMFL